MDFQWMENARVPTQYSRQKSRYSPTGKKPLAAYVKPNDNAGF
jgi:hypothetical protein